jgi:hypothetical protein
MWKRAPEAEKCVCSPWELSKYLITLCVVVPTSHDSKSFFKCFEGWASEPTAFFFSFPKKMVNNYF